MGSTVELTRGEVGDGTAVALRLIERLPERIRPRFVGR